MNKQAELWSALELQKPKTTEDAIEIAKSILSPKELGGFTEWVALNGDYLMEKLSA